MLPTLMGRIQTRIFAIAVIGGIWTLIFTPFLPGLGGADLDLKYKATYSVLINVILYGIVWELLYHFLQQFRWEKDWPTMFGYLQAIPESIVLKIGLDRGLGVSLESFGGVGIIEGIPISPYVWLFFTTWIIVFLFLNGPMRVPFIRWRFRGGRLI